MAGTYKTKSGDTWDVIAKDLYGSEYNADVLMAANPEHLTTFVFNEGVTLITPDVETQPDGSLPPWKFIAGEDDEEDDDD